MDDDGGTPDRHATADGHEVTWRLIGRTARIVRVRTAGGKVARYRAAELDLADAREQWPDLAAVWDAIRHELWAELTGPQLHPDGR